MLGSDRRLYTAIGCVALLAIVIGWITWPRIPSLRSYGAEQPRAGDYRPGGDQCDPKTLASITDKRVASDKRIDCQKQAEEYRLNTNDLIQQTRAADAAKAQADIASQGLWTAWLQSLGGFLTLCAAVAAAIYARDAAKAAREGLSHDRSRTEIELAPYVFPAKLYVKRPDDVFVVRGETVKIELQNYGQTPAFMLKASFHVHVTPYPLNKRPPRTVSKPSYIGDLPPGAHQVLSKPLNRIAPETYNKIGTANALVVYLELEYTSRFSEEPVRMGSFYLCEGSDWKSGKFRMLTHNDERT